MNNELDKDAGLFESAAEEPASRTGPVNQTAGAAVRIHVDCGETPLDPPIDQARESAVARLIDQCERGTFLKATPTLAETAAEYRARKDRIRPGADPIGIGGLPDNRADINSLLLDLCRRLIVAGGTFLRGDRLVEALQISNERTLRLLVAYGRVHHHIRPIVGIYGEGYCWADLADNPAAVYILARGQAVATARCHLFLSTLFGRDDGAMGLVQLVFPFAATAPADDLAALLTAKGIGHEQVLEAMIAHCRASGEEGVAAIRRVAARNQDVLIPADRLADIRRHLHDALQGLAV
jgi:hypothetical protein